MCVGEGRNNKEKRNGHSEETRSEETCRKEGPREEARSEEGGREEACGEEACREEVSHRGIEKYNRLVTTPLRRAPAGVRSGVASWKCSRPFSPGFGMGEGRDSFFSGGMSAAAAAFCRAQKNRGSGKRAQAYTIIPFLIRPARFGVQVTNGKHTARHDGSLREHTGRIVF